jgi:hypothetical protein
MEISRITSSQAWSPSTITQERKIDSNATLSPAEGVKPEPSTNKADSSINIEICVLKSAEQISSDRLQQFIGLNPFLENKKQFLTLEKTVNALNSKIQTQRPSLIGKNWDFTLKDGAIAVTADKNVSGADVQWLNAQLNSNADAVTAIKGFYKSVVSANENNADNPIWDGNGETLHDQYRYANVADQINGKIPIRKMIADIAEPYKPKFRPESNSYNLNSPNEETPFEVGLRRGEAKVLARQYLALTKGDVITYNPYSARFKMQV